MLGVHYKKVQILPYQTEWIDLFAQEKLLLVRSLKSNLVDIEHIGSTAIPGMPAKPIIDILVGVYDTGHIVDYILLLEDIGYQYLGTGPIPERYFFVKGPKSSTTHHLHITTWQNLFWYRQISFRDFLICNYQLAMEYAALKYELAQKFADDRDAYAAGKAEWFAKNFLPTD